MTSDREEVTSVSWKYREDFVGTSTKTKVAIAAYTTSQARLNLYSYLKQLGSMALYADTDFLYERRRNETSFG